MSILLIYEIWETLQTLGPVSIALKQELWGKETCSFVLTVTKSIKETEDNINVNILRLHQFEQF